MFDAHHPFMEFDFLFSLCGPRLLVHPPTKWSLYCPYWLSVLCCVATRHKNHPSGSGKWRIPQSFFSLSFMKSVFSEHCSLSLFILSRKDRWKTEGMERSQDQEESVGETPWVFILLSLSFIWDVITFTFFFLRLGKTKDVKENQRRKEEVRHDVEACIKYGQMGLSESASWSNLDLNLKQPSTIANTLNLCLSRVFVSYL